MTHLRRHHDVIEVSKAQMLEFCCNCLQMRNDRNETFLIMSTQAHAAFRPDQLERLSRYVTRIVPIDVTTIEDEGGGSIRCMTGELF